MLKIKEILVKYLTFILYRLVKSDAKIWYSWQNMMSECILEEMERKFPHNDFYMSEQVAKQSANTILTILSK